MLSERDQFIPDWAQRERWIDLAWIHDNLPSFWSAASLSYEVLGRGAVVVETTFQTPEGGHPAAYLTQDQIARYEDADIDRLITGYAPDGEFVVILLKDAQRTSAYRVQNCLPGADLSPNRPTTSA